MCYTCLRDHRTRYFTQHWVIYRCMRWETRAPGKQASVPYLLRQILTTCSSRAVSAMSLGFHGNASFTEYCNVTLQVYQTILYGKARAFLLARRQKIGSCKAVCELKQLESDGNLTPHCLSDARKTMNEKLQRSKNPKILILGKAAHACICHEL